MKFSIVTPNYNYGRFLRKAIQSVFDQTSSPDMSIEHIVIDGGSTDGSVSILKDWASFAAAQPAAKAGRYSFSYVSEPDKGQTDAINKGLRRATGDIVAWLNADEWYLPGKLALVAAAFAKHPSTDFVYGEPLFVDKDGNPIRVKRDHPFSKFVLLYYGCHISSCASFWRRKIQIEGKVYLDPDYKVTMDYEFYCHICRIGYRFLFLPATIAAFTWHGGNVSSRFELTRTEEDAKVKALYASNSLTCRPFPRLTSALLVMFFHQIRRCLILIRLAALPIERISQERAT